MILRAARRRLSGSVPSETFAARLGQAYGGAGAPDVDLLIRAGGEQRLSDFLLWESAYAELRFVARMWRSWTNAAMAVAAITANVPIEAIALRTSAVILQSRGGTVRQR